MDEQTWPAGQFEAHRGHLRRVAHRMLGSFAAAEDAVQETWLRLNRTDTSNVENLRGWLTTVVGRVCLDMLRSRKTRAEEPLDIDDPDSAPDDDDSAQPEHDLALADSVGLAMLVVLEALTPAERVAFVLHDLFELPFDEIARILDRSPASARQLASRARRRIQGASATREADAERKREVVAAFLTASRDGDFEALLTLLDPNVVLRADAAAVTTGAPREVLGATSVAETFRGRARAARLAIINGTAGAVWSSGAKPRIVFEFTLRDRTIVEIGLIADPETLSKMTLDDPSID